MIKTVYISGPYTKGGMVQNIQRIIAVAEILTSRGYLVFVPHLSHLWDLISPHPYEFWMWIDLAWVRRCDAVFRVSGDSSGADREVNEAIINNIPVYTDLSELPDLIGNSIETQEPA